jgi:hypothetical protein
MALAGPPQSHENGAVAKVIFTPVLGGVFATFAEYAYPLRTLLYERVTDGLEPATFGATSRTRDDYPKAIAYPLNWYVCKCASLLGQGGGEFAAEMGMSGTTRPQTR